MAPTSRSSREQYILNRGKELPLPSGSSMLEASDDGLCGGFKKEDQLVLHHCEDSGSVNGNNRMVPQNTRADNGIAE